MNLQDVSYIRSRDPSIQNFDRRNLKNVRRNLQYNTILEAEDNCTQEDAIQIFLRIKPSKNEGAYFIRHNELLYSTVAKHNEEIHKRIVFSKIYGSRSKQEEIFNDIVKIRVFDFLNGVDTTIFTYGAPGAGKNYTTVGTAENPGFLPRTLEYVFKTLPDLPEMALIKPTPEGNVIKLNLEERKLELNKKKSFLRSQKTKGSKNIKSYQAMQDTLRNEPFASLEQLSEVTIGVWVSFVEIFNEEIYDLLESNIPCISGRKKLHIGITNGKLHIKNLTHVCVSNSLEAYLIYQWGLQNLNTLKTNVHGYSSRSHSIFTIKMAHSLVNEETCFISALNICNLAGVDGTKKPMDKNQLKEYNTINNSIMVLGMCMNKLEAFSKNPSTNQSIPYRDSKLTRYLYRSLTGLENSCMIINLNSSKDASDENQHILNFSALKKDVVSKEIMMGFMSNQTSHLQELEGELEQLQEVLTERKAMYQELKKSRSKNYELEKANLENSWEEVFEDSKKIFITKKKMKEQGFENSYQLQKQNFESLIRNIIEQKEKIKLDEEMKNLKEKVLENEEIINNLQMDVSRYEHKLKEVTDLGLEIKDKNEIIATYERILEEREMDSFLLNEEHCENIPITQNNSSPNSCQINFDSEDTVLLDEITNKDEDERINMLSRESICDIYEQKTLDLAKSARILKEREVDSFSLNEKSCEMQNNTFNLDNTTANSNQSNSNLKETEIQDSLTNNKENEYCSIIGTKSISLLNEESIPEMVSSSEYSETELSFLKTDK